MRKKVDGEQIKALGKRIARIRKSKHITQEELADVCDMTLSQIARIETGVINTSIGTLFNLSKGLGVEIAEFFKTEN